jgi:hypothetical protein
MKGKTELLINFKWIFKMLIPTVEINEPSPFWLLNLPSLSKFHAI